MFTDDQKNKILLDWGQCILHWAELCAFKMGALSSLELINYITLKMHQTEKNIEAPLPI